MFLRIAHLAATICMVTLKLSAPSGGGDKSMAKAARPYYLRVHVTRGPHREPAHKLPHTMVVRRLACVPALCRPQTCLAVIVLQHSETMPRMLLCLKIEGQVLTRLLPQLSQVRMQVCWELRQKLQGLAAL